MATIYNIYIFFVCLFTVLGETNLAALSNLIKCHISTELVLHTSGGEKCQTENIYYTKPADHTKERSSRSVWKGDWWQMSMKPLLPCSHVQFNSSHLKIRANNSEHVEELMTVTCEECIKLPKFIINRVYCSLKASPLALYHLNLSLFV